MSVLLMKETGAPGENHRPIRKVTDVDSPTVTLGHILIGLTNKHQRHPSIVDIFIKKCSIICTNIYNLQTRPYFPHCTNNLGPSVNTVIVLNTR